MSSLCVCICIANGAGQKSDHGGAALPGCPRALPSHVHSPLHVTPSARSCAGWTIVVRVPEYEGVDESFLLFKRLRVWCFSLVLHPSHPPRILTVTLRILLLSLCVHTVEIATSGLPSEVVFIPADRRIPNIILKVSGGQASHSFACLYRELVGWLRLSKPTDRQRPPPCMRGSEGKEESGKGLVSFHSLTSTPLPSWF